MCKVFSQQPFSSKFSWPFSPPVGFTTLDATLLTPYKAGQLYCVLCDKVQARTSNRRVTLYFFQCTNWRVVEQNWFPALSLFMPKKGVDLYLFCIKYERHTASIIGVCFAASTPPPPIKSNWCHEFIWKCYGYKLKFKGVITLINVLYF